MGFLSDPVGWSQRRIRRHGPVFRSHLFGRSTLVVSGAEAVQFVLTNEERLFAAGDPEVRIPKVFGGTAYTIRHLLGNKSLIAQQGPAHRESRQWLSKVLGTEALPGCAPLMEQVATRHIGRWAERGELEWYPAIQDFSFEIVARLFLGADDKSLLPLRRAFNDWGRGLFSAPIDLPWTRFGRAMRSRAKIVSYLRERIQTDNGEHSGAAIDALRTSWLQRGRAIEDSEFLEQMMLLMFAGHETVASALVSFFVFVSQHGDVRERLCREQQQSVSTPLGFESLREFQYLGQAIKEVLRLNPPVGGGFRHVIADFEYGKWSVSKGWIALYLIGPTHRDPSVYREPERFDPDRFGQARREEHAKPFAYIPFGFGPRACLGSQIAILQIRMLAALVLRHCDWEISPNQDLRFAHLPVPHPRSGVTVRFRLHAHGRRRIGKSVAGAMSAG